MSEALSTLPVVVSAIQGVEAALTAAGASIRLVNAPACELPDAVRREKFDGLILKGALQGDLAAAVGPVALDRLKDVPAVWILGRPIGLPGDGVTAHDWRAGQLAAEYLLARGHRRLAFLNPKPDHAGFRVRAAGFTERVAGRATVRQYLGRPAAGRPFPLPPVQSVDAVGPLLDALLADSPPPTAVYVPADNIAALVYRAAAARGISVGQELSVVSCNYEQSLTAGLYPALATVDIRADQVGRVAVGQLARRVAGDSGPVVDIHVDPEMVPGDSVAVVG